MYLMWFAQATAFFFGVYFFWYLFFETKAGSLIAGGMIDRYHKRNASDRAYMLSAWTGNTHHVIICFLIFEVMIWDQPCSNTPGVFAWLHDMECFTSIDKRHVFANMVSLGYITYDFVIQYFFVAGTDSFAKQMIFHHLISITGIMSAQYAGYGVVAANTLTLGVEFSTVFLNYRSSYFKEELGE
mmetsp:Transcript_19237/g.29492  ORF Transcript_19237/g.29492 Transcript_19237/m.29492 type:complete len:185 (+) Transcript_19237:102-656(+)